MFAAPPLLTSAVCLLFGGPQDLRSHGDPDGAPHPHRHPQLHDRHGPQPRLPRQPLPRGPSPRPPPAHGLPAGCGPQRLQQVHGGFLELTSPGGGGNPSGLLMS